MADKPKSYWDLLRGLRQNFLTETPVIRDYWSDSERVAAYDETFGERIAWKWQAVLAELATIGWSPSGGTSLIDWGCGTAIASRVFTQQRFGKCDVTSVFLYDRSPKAQEFARQRLTQHQTWHGDIHLGLPVTWPPQAGLLLSHVLTELPERGITELMEAVAKCQFVLAVEPGTKEAATKLGRLRDRLLAEGWHAVAPCTHPHPCPAVRSEKHWCHSFASPPQEVFHSPFWREFSEQLKIDLRVLPYSYVLLEKESRTLDSAERSARVIGRPRLHKTHAQALLCSAEGISDKRFISRKNPAEFHKISKRAPWL